MKVTKRKIKVETTNNRTGEIYKSVQTQTDYVYKRPVNGYKGTYMKRLENIVNLSKSAQKLFFSVIDNVNDYNKVDVKWNVMSDLPASNLSRAKKELEEHEFIAKIGKSWVLNPFIVLPRYQTQSPEVQHEVQMIYRRYVENMNDWYEGIEDDAKELYGVTV